MIEVYVQSAGLVVWAAGMLLAGFLIHRPERKHRRRWWQKPVPWYRPDPGTLAFAVSYGVV